MKSQHSAHPSRARLTRLLCVLGIVFVSVPFSTRVWAGSNETSEQVAERIVQLQARADRAAATSAQLDADAAALAVRLTDGQAALGSATVAYSAMEVSMAAIAVNRFMGVGTSGIALLGEDPVLGLERNALANVAIGAGDVSLDRFDALRHDLAEQQDQLTSLRRLNDDAQAKLASNQADMTAKLAQLADLEINLKNAEVKQAYDLKMAKLRADEKAAVAASAAAEIHDASDANVPAEAPSDTPATRPTAVRAAVDVVVPQQEPAPGTTVDEPNAPSSSVTPTTGPPVPVQDTAVSVPPTDAPSVSQSPVTEPPKIEPPTTEPPTTDPPATDPSATDPPAAVAVTVRGSWLCPVAGPNAFGDTFGDPRPGGRKHEGVDMMSPLGTPLVAVVAGFAKMKTNKLGGNVVGLTGADGNYYYYAHLSDWAGPSRDVQAGEIIGYVGHTGDTAANHLHFEIHPGGGSAIDPYNTVRSHC